MMKPTTQFGPALALLMGALLNGCSPPNTFVAPPPPEVTVQAPAQRPVTVYLEVPGRLEAVETVEIRARVSGYLKSVDFMDGEIVKAGRQLFVIEPEPYLTALEAARAGLAEAHAATNLAVANYERRKRVFDKSRAISEIEVITAEANMKSAMAALLAAEAAVKQAEIDLSYTTNRAPIAGILNRHQVSVGNLVGGKEATLLSTLVAVNPIYLYFNVSERDILPELREHPALDESARQKNMQIKVELADGQVYGREGRVDYWDKTLDPQTGTLTVRAVFENPTGELLPGLYGKALVPRQLTNDTYHLVPDLCVQRDLGGSYVLVVGAENKVEQLYVEPGPKVGRERVITSGLTGSERVIVNGLQKARPGALVQPVTGTAPSTPTAGPAAAHASPTPSGQSR